MRFRFRLLAAISVSLCAGVPAASALELNIASRAQLEQIRGIGVIAADRILVERDKGDFTNWEDFMHRVKGFKKAASARLSDAGLTVQGAEFPRALRLPVSSPSHADSDRFAPSEASPLP